MDSSISFFLHIIRLGIGTEGCLSLGSYPDQIDWDAMEALAQKQGLLGVFLDGIERLPEAIRPSKQVRLRLIGNVTQTYERRYMLYRRAIAEMAGFFNGHGIRTMVLKGLACALDWPRPEHRPCGDIDIWQFGKQKEADALLAKEKGVKIDSAHHHHTVYYWGEFMVENHYDFLNVHHQKSNVELEAILKELGTDDSFFAEIDGEKVYLPSPNLHALFLLRHAMSHFASTGLSLRQLLDWAFFVKCHGEKIDWEWLVNILGRFKMIPLFQIFNAICVEDLGFAPAIFQHNVEFEPRLKERVLSEIFSREFSEKTPDSIFKRIPFKFRRWKANAWKYELYSRDSRWSSFWSGVWSHLRKPSSI